MTEIPPTQPETAVILKNFDNNKIIINDGAAKKVVEKYKYRSKKFKTFQPTLNEEAQIPPPEVTVTGLPPLKHPSNTYIEMMKTTKVVLLPLPESGPVPGPPAR